MKESYYALTESEFYGTKTLYEYQYGKDNHTAYQKNLIIVVFDLIIK